MEKKIENLENFKKAITSTIKSIIGDQNIDVTFGNEVTKKKISIQSIFQVFKQWLIKLIILKQGLWQILRL